MNKPSESFKKAQKHVCEAIDSLLKAQALLADEQGVWVTSDVGHLLDSADSVMRVASRWMLSREVQA